MTEQLQEISEQTDTEELFSKIINSPSASERLFDTFYSSLETEEDIDSPDPQNFTRVLLTSYHDRNINPLLLEICHKSMFDLFRDAYLIPRRLMWNANNAVVKITDEEGNLLKDTGIKVLQRTYSRFQTILKKHQKKNNSIIFLADGYDSNHFYNENLDMKEDVYDKTLGVLVLYELPDTIPLGYTRAKVYAKVWDAFNEIEESVPSAVVYYGQETGNILGRQYDELGVLIPIHALEKRILKDLDITDKIMLEYEKKLVSNS